ncbi:hypothetical protein NDU88_003502 [Pleurodeles waltl]|uniref:Uncharacterized protein n=1 Tax=Pleurodeles waltl TaxID=8319 RepID=A0AAV7T5G1_PLEWA|nr:hypothetical protein NDU88_003502 [Pleurodeles waltl]
MKTTRVTIDLSLQEWRPGSDSPTNEFHWMHPRDQPEGGRNREEKGREKIGHGEAEEHRECEEEKKQRDSRYIKKQEQQRRGVSNTGFKPDATKPDGGRRLGRR